jgi:anti-sigma factor RsiW
MDCEEFRATYSEFADGALDELSEVRVFRHMSECAACRRLHDAYRAGRLTLRRLPRLLPSPDFAQSLSERLKREEATGGEDDRAQPKPWAALAGAMALVVAAAGSGWVLMDRESARPVVVNAPDPHRRSRPVVVRFSGDSTLSYPGRFPVIPVYRDNSPRPLGTPASMEITVDWMFP